MSTMKNNPKGASVRSESDQSRVNLRVLSPSPDAKEYFQYTRNFPSSNPIKSARPDLLSFVERIPMTQNPGGPNLLNRRELLKKSHRESTDHDKENNVENHLMAEIDRLNEELKGKEEEIKKLRNRNIELEKMSSELKASVHSFSGTPMKEKDAKDLAKRFAKERLQAEVDAEEWKQRYKALEKKLREMEMAEPKEAPNKKEKEVSKDLLKDLQQKILELENKVLSSTNENDKLKSMLKERNTEIDNLKVRVGSKDREIDELKTELRKIGDKSPLDAKIKDLNGQIDIWRNKANFLEEQWDKEQKRFKDLQESRDKYENDLKNAKNDLDQAKKLISKLENVNQELERLRAELELSKRKLDDLEPFRKRFEESEVRNKALIVEIEALKGRLNGVEEWGPLHEKEIEVWRRRCDEIEKEWGEKYKSLEFEMDELGLYTGNLKDFEEQIAVLRAENENWKAKCFEIESEWNEKHGRIQTQMEKMKGNEAESLISTVFLLMIEIERLNVLIKLLESEREAENTRKSRVEKEKKTGFDDNLAKIAALNEELSRKDRVLKAKEAEIEELIRKCDVLRSYQGNGEFLKQKISDLERQVARFDQLTSENVILREKIRQLEASESEIAKWRGLYESLRVEYDAFQHKSTTDYDLQARLRYFEGENARLLAENEDYNRKYLEKGDFESKTRFLSSEITRLEQENEEIKRKYYEEMSRKGENIELENKVALLSSELQRVNRELENQRRASLELEAEKRRIIEDKMLHIHEESAKKAQMHTSYIEQDLKEKNQRLVSELEELKTRYGRLEVELQKANNSSEVMNLEFELELKNKKVREYELLLQEKSSTSLLHSEHLAKENERLRIDFEELKRKFSFLELETFKKGNVDTENQRKVAVLQAEIERNACNLADKSRENKMLIEENLKRSREAEEAGIKLRIAENQMLVLDSKIQGLIEEIEAWKVRYENLERFKAKEFEDMKTHSEAIRKSQLDREIRDLTIKGQNERMRLEAEIKRLQGLYELQNNEMAIIKGKTMDVNAKNRLEEAFFLISGENERLNSYIAILNERAKGLEEEKLRLSQFYQEKQVEHIESAKKSSMYQTDNLREEIKQLNKELEEWRTKARTAELENYGVTSLSQQNNELRSQIVSLNRDHQEIVETLNEKKRYIEKLREKKRTLKARLRNSLTVEQNSQVLLREIDSVKIENQHLKEDLERLQRKSLQQSAQFENNSLQLKQDELNRLTLRLQSVEQDLDTRIKELKDWQGKYYQIKSDSAGVQELRTRVSTLEYENSAQRSEISRLEQENIRKSHHEHQKKAFMAETEDKQKRINTLAEELERWKEKCRDLEGSSADRRILEQKLKDWEQRVNALLIDNDRLLKEKTGLEIRVSESLGSRDVDIRLRQLEERRIAEIEELKRHLEVLKNAHFDSRGVEFEAERMAYETLIGQMRNKIAELEGTGALIMREGEENKLLLANKMREMEEFRGRLRVYEEKGTVGNYNTEESDRLRRQITDLRESLLRTETEKRGLEMQLDQLGFTIKSLQGELENMRVLMEERRKERNEALKQLEEARAENQMLNLNTRGSFGVTNETFYTSGDRSEELMRKIKELETSKEFFRSQADRNSMELTSKNMELIEKIQELEDLKTKYQDSLNNLHRLEAKLLEKLQQEEVFIG